ncbi:hypothetical protein QZH41_017531, partial [Actinostola sp. cb2023]
ENCLHMAIVNENLNMVHFLCKNGINIHERAFGAFFCPEDQQDMREDDECKETIILNDETDYKSNTYWGEYPLSFAACLGQVDTVKYLIHRKACPNKQDTNGNTVLHMVVIHDRPMFQHIVNKSCEVFWEYGGVYCAAFPLKHLDTVSKHYKHKGTLCWVVYLVGDLVLGGLPCRGPCTDNQGQMMETSALNIIIHEDSSMHLELLDGIIHNILDQKWKKGCRFRFFQLFFLYIIYLMIIGVALYLKPSVVRCFSLCKSFCSQGMRNVSAVFNNSFPSNKTACDRCFLRKAVYESTSQMVRGAFEILANIWAISYLVLLVIEMISQGFKTVVLGLVYNPIRGLFALSCALVPLCLMARLMCHVALEDYLTITALVLAWPYALMFCKGFSLTGPYVVMIYQMLKKDFIIFFIIYMVFVIGFSQAMFLVSLGYVDSTVKEHMFSRWFSSGLGLIIMSLGEFGDLHEQLMESNSPFKILGLVMFFAFMVLGALLIVNMLIAMMGNTYLAVEKTEKEWTRQWARIVLGIERMLTPKQKIKLQQSYSEPLGSDGDYALIMKLRNNRKVTALIVCDLLQGN